MASKSGGASCARPSKRVEDEIPRLGIRFNERCKSDNRLLIGVKLVRGVLPGQYIRGRAKRPPRPPFSEQKPDLMETAAVTFP